MPIAEIPEIEEVLSSIQLSSDPPRGDATGVPLPFRPASDETGRVQQESLWLNYSSETKISFPRLLDKVAKQLGEHGHPKSDEVALFVIALARLMPNHVGSAVARLNIVLSSVCDADVSLYYIITPNVFYDFYQFEMPPFHLGRLRSDKLKYRSDKAGSDYYGRYSDRFRDAGAVERDPKPVRVLDMMSFRHRILDVPILDSKRDFRVRAWNAITDEYFQVTKSMLFDEFWEEFTATQDPLLSLGAQYFDPQTMRSPIFQFEQVAIFLNLGLAEMGYVAPSRRSGFNVNLGTLHLQVPQLLGELKAKYGFKHFDTTPLHSSIKLFASFVARAHRHHLNSHIEEALLHYITALELIFGVRETIQKSVAERVAILTFRHFGYSFDQQRRWIEKIYHLRSRYVHEGTKLNHEQDIDDVRHLYALCQEVFRCLLRLQAARSDISQRQKNALDEWVNLLDFLAKGLIAERQIDESQLKEAFIACPPTMKVGP
jgi:hypothetical protein